MPIGNIPEAYEIWTLYVPDTKRVSYGVHIGVPLYKYFSFTLFYPTTFHLTISAANIICNENTTEFLSWPDTLAGTTQTLPCPTTTAMISRNCSLSGEWESVDLTLCTSFASISTVSFSMDFSIDFQFDVNGTSILLHYRLTSHSTTMERFLQG